ncbi:hypothetical protein HPB48_017266 [Haemaphysalis longicornis]|uniref:Carboxylesterase type B domain-containing protein n=1 Tax=Haemaphysalis longicornis TaxID=44386 RepID=A0A9J6FND2_HAELO|nr:hypothetical protein HPB48_017266 [Haemaphysalis longicornis]
MYLDFKTHEARAHTPTDIVPLMTMMMMPAKFLARTYNGGLARAKLVVEIREDFKILERERVESKEDGKEEIGPRDSAPRPTPSSMGENTVAVDRTASAQGRRHCKSPGLQIACANGVSTQSSASACQAQAGGNIAQKPGDLPDTEKKEMITNTLPLIGAVVLVIGLMVVIVVGLLVIPHPSPADSAAVSTTSGDFVGEKLSVHGVEVYRWLGIPYAESTAGKNRFQMPVPSTVKRRTMANESRPPCAQWVNGKVVGSEDCLHMNVWAPIRSRAAGSNRTLVLASSSYWFQRSSNNDTYWSELAAKGEFDLSGRT